MSLCGCSELTYYDDDFPIYGFCPKCKEWVSGGKGFDTREVAYITSKLRMIKNIAEKLEVKE